MCMLLVVPRNHPLPGSRGDYWVLDVTKAESLQRPTVRNQTGRSKSPRLAPKNERGSPENTPSIQLSPVFQSHEELPEDEGHPPKDSTHRQYGL
ncbi:hypothetical protein CVT25_007643 [Psilocybe cyanescens]|uniref:Uncharacterized protein n=1 Tax=Psilocybe cyanescens TaxID=93625 RepID=A0A409X1E7_PSICY|nr:hypothetical protein CVT25_007643 [Psilocybe cyanescens]